MFSFLKKKDHRALHYDSKLIKNFHKDHQKLIKSIKKISYYLDRNNEKKAKNLLKQLKTTMLNHFMEEDIKLYRYLKKYYCDSNETLAVVKNFETTIKIIQRDVVEFLDCYTQENSKLNNDFKEKFYAIVNDLDSRIETEEQSLYTLYIK
jgi:RNase P subunit RPR2